MSDAVSLRPLAFVTRLWFSLVCLLRVLSDGDFASRVWAVKDGMPELPSPASDDERDAEPPSSDAPESPSVDEEEPDLTTALMLLSLLQREGRLVDFLEQDITDFDDAEIGAAARVVHEGCRKALRAHAEVVSVRSEPEDAKVKVTEGIDTGEVKLTGKVGRKPPYEGVLRHRGWRVEGLSLPQPQKGHDETVIAPAEVEL